MRQGSAGSEGQSSRRSRLDFTSGVFPESHTTQSQDGDDGSRSEKSRRRRAVESLVSKVTKKTNSGSNGTKASDLHSGVSTPALAVPSPGASGQEEIVRSRYEQTNTGEDVAGGEREGGGGGGTDREALRLAGVAEVSPIRR